MWCRIPGVVIGGYGGALEERSDLCSRSAGDCLSLKSGDYSRSAHRALMSARGYSLDVMIGGDAAKRVANLPLRPCGLFDTEAGWLMRMVRRRHCHSGLTKRVPEFCRRKTLSRKPTTQSGVLKLSAVRLNRRASKGYQQDWDGRDSKQGTWIRE